MPPLLMLDTVDSTISEAERQAASGWTGKLVICARIQTGGTGRHGRPWASPPGNLYWTMLLDDEPERPRDAGLAFAAGLAVRDALVGVGLPAERLGLKWPNDILLDGRKLAGILVQLGVEGGRARTVVGIGINVVSSPPQAVFPATAIADSGLAIPDLTQLRDALTAAFLARRDTWHRHGFSALRDAVAAVLHGVGAPARIAYDRDRTHVLEGINEGMNDAGALLLRTADGKRHTVVAGDVLA